MNKKKLNYEHKKCSSCGSNLIFSPKHNGLFCKSCKNIYEIESSSNILVHTFENKIECDNSYNDWANQNKILKCKDCGAEVILDKLEFSNTCSYCGSSLVSSITELPGLKPDGVIPFKFDGHDAMLRFRENIKKKWFIPNYFKKNIPTSDLMGTYIACFSFNTKTFSQYSGVFSYNETYTDSNGESRTKTYYVNVSGTYSKNFENMLIESNQHITDSELNDIKPFDFNEQKNFNQDYLKGYIVEHYSNDANACFNIAKAKITNVIKQALLSKHNCTNICSLNLNTNYTEKSYIYYLLPVYFFMYKYKDRTYKTIMNGQNGKLGSNVPRSGIKITFFVLMILILFFSIFVLPFIL